MILALGRWKRTTSEARWPDALVQFMSTRMVRNLSQKGPDSSWHVVFRPTYTYATTPIPASQQTCTHTLKSCCCFKRFFVQLCRLSIPVTKWLSQTTEREGMFIWGSQFPKDRSKAYWLHCLELMQGPDKVGSRWWPGNKGRQKRAGLNHSPKVHPQSLLLVPHPFSCELLDGLTMAEISFFPINSATGWTSVLQHMTFYMQITTRS